MVRHEPGSEPMQTNCSWSACMSMKMRMKGRAILNQTSRQSRCSGLEAREAFVDMYSQPISTFGSLGTTGDD